MKIFKQEISLRNSWKPLSTNKTNFNFYSEGGITCRLFCFIETSFCFTKHWFEYFTKLIFSLEVKNAFLLHILFVFTTSSLRCQTPVYSIFDDRNGIFDFEQYDLLQDRKGYIWIAGNSGLHRYNAKEFKHFAAINSPSRALTGLRDDSFRRLWMVDFAGNIYYQKDNILRPFKQWNPRNSKTFPIVEIDKKHLWIVTEEGVNRFENAPSLAKIKHLKTYNIPTSRVTCIYQNQLYVAGENEIYTIDKKATRIAIDGQHKPQFLKAWSSFFIVKNQLHLYVRDENSIYKLEKDRFVKIKEFEQLGDFIALKVVDNTPWILTRNGLIRLDENFEIQENLFEGFACSDLLKDNQGNYWLSTLNKGVIFFTDLNARYYNLNQPTGFNTFVKWKNGLYVGTNDGRISVLGKNSLAISYQSKTFKEISFLSVNPWTKELYFGEMELMKSTERRLESLGTNPSIKQMVFIHPNAALIADPGGLYVSVFNTEKDVVSLVPEFLKPHLSKTKIQFKNFSHYYLIYNRTPRFSIWKNQLFAATKNGLVALNKFEKRNVCYQGKPIFVTDFELTKNAMYCATSNHGLLSWNGAIWEKVNDKIGVNQYNYIQQVCANENKVWFATDNGIIQMDLSTKKHLLFDASNGLLSTRIADLFLEKNALYVSTNQGVLKLPLYKTKQQVCNPPFLLSQLFVNGQEKNLKNLDFIESNPGTVTFKFDVLWFANPNRLHIKYKLDDEEEWSELAAGNFQFTLNKIYPEQHQLFVRLVDNLSGRTIAKKKVDFYVKPTLFQRPLFQFCFFGVLVIAVVALVLFYLRTIKRKNLQLLEKERLQRQLKQSMLSAIKAQMNPHFIFNALNTIQSYILTNDRMNANFYLGKFSDLMRKILTMSNQETITIEEELAAMRLYLELENMRLNKELNIQLETDDAIEIMHKQIPSMIVQPYIENAIKHGLLHKVENKELKIIFKELTNDILLVEITDNGIGRKASQKIKERSNKHYVSFSTEANKKRLELLNEQTKNDISIQIIDLEEFGQSSGTKVILKIPIK
ncbi:MAG: hypothetical protein RL264_1700 [Bacteroidota bacterium]